MSCELLTEEKTRVVSAMIP